MSSKQHCIYRDCVCDFILRSSISTFEAFNSFRDNESFAHDNELIDAKEARFIFASVVVVLRFIKAIEAERFEVAA